MQKENLEANACQAFGINQTCYRYKAKPDLENFFIAAYLMR